MKRLGRTRQAESKIWSRNEAVEPNCISGKRRFFKMDIGDRIVRKRDERKGYVYDVKPGRVVMVKVRWLENKQEEWLPDEELRIWDKLAIPRSYSASRPRCQLPKFGGTMNWMTAKFKGECVSCTRNIDEGERILFDFEERESYCSKCGERIKPDPKGKQQ
jgi:hypothetical protein